MASHPTSPEQPDRAEGIGFASIVAGDPEDPDRGKVRTGDPVIARHARDPLRLLLDGDAERVQVPG